jgi:hypothetical protein
VSTSGPDWVTAGAAGVIAITSVATAWNQRRTKAKVEEVAEKVEAVHKDIRTGNTPIGALIEAEEGRRAAEIPPQDRTESETRSIYIKDSDRTFREARDQPD